MACYSELIERVKPHPEIWQFSHPLFKNKMSRAKFWHRISKEMKMDEQQLRKNWKYLADQYRREFKKTMAQESKVGEAVDSSWAYYEALSFLKPGMMNKQDKRPPITQVSSESDNDSTQEPTQTAYASFQDENDDNNSWQYNKPAKPAKKARVTKADLILRKIQNLDSTVMNCNSEVLKNDEDYMYFMSVLPMVRTLPPLKKLQLRGKINDWMMEMMSEREDPLNSVSHYALVESEEDDKEAIRDQIMAEDDD